MLEAYTLIRCVGSGVLPVFVHNVQEHHEKGPSEEAPWQAEAVSRGWNLDVLFVTWPSSESHRTSKYLFPS